MWKDPNKEMPYPHQVVEAVSPEGKQLDMYRIGGLWFVAGESSYVYWTPKLWRAK